MIGYERETGKRADIAYMIDQSHNLKDKIEEMIQTAITAQELYSKAVLVDHEKLTHHQMKGELIDAEECLKAAFSSDVRPAIREWRKSKGLAEDPLQAFRASGYTAQAARVRGPRRIKAPWPATRDEVDLSPVTRRRRRMRPIHSGRGI